MSRASEKESKEAHILECAARLFARFGLRKTTIDDIARDAGLGKGTIYLYFESKEAIFTAFIKNEMAQTVKKLQREVERAVSVEDKLKRYLSSSVRYVAERMKQLGVTRDSILESHLLMPEMDKLRDDCRAEVREVLRGIVEEGMRLGMFRVRDLDFVLLAISSTVEGLTSPWFGLGRNLAVEATVDALSQFLIEGLKGSDHAQA